MFNSTSKEITQINIPSFTGKTGDNLYMLPFTMKDLTKIPAKWKEWLLSIKNYIPSFEGIAYLTIDQKLIKPNKHHRRGGAHIDGNYIANCWGSGWLNGKEGKMISPKQHNEMYLKKGLGTLIISDYAACQVWDGEFDGEPNSGGNCEHLRDQFDSKKSYVMEANKLYWMDSQCVHESLLIPEITKRTLARITLPLK